MTKLFSAALSRGTLRPLERKPFHLYVDEFQNLATDTTATMLSEARKFGLYLTMANQNLNQLKNKNGQFNVAESILSNVATKILFRLGIADALDLKPYFESALSVADMVELPDFHAVCRIMSANKPLPPFVAKMQRAPENPSMPVANEIRAKCRAQYARPRAIVEGEIERLYRTEGGEVTSGGGA